jgi:hypothetical protein
MRLDPNSPLPLSEELKCFINAQNSTMQTVNFAEDYSKVRESALSGGGIQMDAVAREMAAEAKETAQAANSQAIDTQRLIVDEENRAKHKENDLNSSIEAEISRAQAEEQKIEGEIADEASRAQAAESANAGAIAAEIQRAQTEENNLQTTLQAGIDAEAQTRSQADAALQTDIGAESTRAQGAEAAKVDKLVAGQGNKIVQDVTFDILTKFYVKTLLSLADGAKQTYSGVLPIATESELADESAALQALITAVNSKIPDQASAANKLADKAFVNSSIQSNVANRVYADAAKSNFQTRAELLAATEFFDANGAAYAPSNNDYTIVVADEAAEGRFNGGQTRWKWSGSPLALGFDYGVNESPFTAAQQAALDSGITEARTADMLGKSEVAAGYTPQGSLQINGVTGETQMNDAEEIALYTHHLKIRVMNGTTFVIWFGLELFLNDDAPFTDTTFWQWLAAQGYTSEANSKPINGRYTTDGQSSLDAGAVWVNAAVTQISVATIASTGMGIQNIALSGKTTVVSDFVKAAPFNIAAHKHGFNIEDMSGGFTGLPDAQVLKAKNV